MKNFSLILLCIVVFACKSDKNKSFVVKEKDITIAGKVINMNPDDRRVVKANFFNPFEASSRAARIDPNNGTFAIKYLMPYPTDFTFDYYNFIYMYAEPGDSVFITIDAEKIRNKDFNNAFVFSGNRADFNNSYAKFITYLDSYQSYLMNPGFKADSIPFDDFKKKIEETAAMLSDSLNAYAARTNAPDNVLAHIKGNMADLMSYYWAQGYKAHDNTEKGRDEKIEIMKHPVFDTYNPARMKGQMFSYHLRPYMFILVRGNEDFKALMQSGDTIAAYKKGIDILKNEPEGFNRDFMAYAFTEVILMQKADIMNDETTRYVQTAISTPYVKTKIEELIKPKDFVYPDIAMPGVAYLNAGGVKEDIPEQNIVKYLNKRYPGKLLYVDIWATWCRPCIGEFSHASELHKKLTDENVEFIYLCLRSDESKWLEMAEKHTSYGENYYFDMDATNLFMPSYNVDCFPTYLFITADGKIIKDVGRPSEAGTEEKIKSLSE